MCDAQCGRGLAEVAVLGDCDEVADQSQVKVHPVRCRIGHGVTVEPAP